MLKALHLPTLTVVALKMVNIFDQSQRHQVLVLALLAETTLHRWLSVCYVRFSRSSRLFSVTAQSRKGRQCWPSTAGVSQTLRPRFHTLAPSLVSPYSCSSTCSRIKNQQWPSCQTISPAEPAAFQIIIILSIFSVPFFQKQKQLYFSFAAGSFSCRLLFSFRLR